MKELILFFVVLALLSIFDIHSMKKAKLKKEIIPYLGLTLLAATLGLLYFTDPYGKSISYHLLNLFNMGD